MGNSVSQLRQKELSVATRPFRARGAKVKRCEQCLIPLLHCICHSRPAPSTNAIFVFLMYKGECLKPSNTGRLVADVVEENYAFTWHRTEPQPALLDLLSRTDVLPMLIFPHEYAAPHRRLDMIPPAPQGKRLLFILLDGTWREARKMFSKSVYLQHIPVIAVNPKSPSTYVLRASHHDYQLCTAEVAIEILALANETQAAADLSQYFAFFKHQYVKEKPHKQLSDD